MQKVFVNMDRAKLAQYLPSLVDTAEELKAVARTLGAAAGDIHLGSDASEATVKRTALADDGVVYLRPMVSPPGMSRGSANRRSRSRCQRSRASLTTDS